MPGPGGTITIDEDIDTTNECEEGDAAFAEAARTKDNTDSDMSLTYLRNNVNAKRQA